MALSGSADYLTTRDDIIKRALRIIGALGQGETPQTIAVTEASQTLQDIVKEWQADGYNIWKVASYSTVFPTASNYVKIGVGQTVPIPAPLKIVDCYRRTGTGTSILDVPLTKMTLQEWWNIPNKATQGVPTHWIYHPFDASTTSPVPGSIGLLRVWPQTNDYFNTTLNGTIVFTYMDPHEDLDAAGNNPDIPTFLINALVWALADQLAYEYGVPIAERAQIAKKAQYHKSVAMNFDQEEGSLFLQPSPNWGE